MLVLLLALTGVIAAADWWAVWRGAAAVERVAKPAVMVSLIGVALVVAADPSAARWLVIGGLLFGVVGDVMLLPTVDRFLAGLGAFLIGHCFYVAAFATMELAAIGVVGGVAAAAAVMTYLGWPIVRAVRGTPHGVPVLGYMVVIVAMVIMATATHRWPIAAGGVLFAVSDGLLGRDRFVAPAPSRRVVVHMLYHLGQAGFVLGLAWAP